MRQQSLFTQNTIHNINIYHEASKTESRTESSGVKLSPTQKEALKSISQEHGIGTSTFIAEAIDFYLEMLPHVPKIQRHKELLHQLLNGLT